MKIYDHRWAVYTPSRGKTAILEVRRVLLEPLLNHADPAVRVWAEGLRNRIIAAAAAQERDRELIRDREDERFE